MPPARPVFVLIGDSLTEKGLDLFHRGWVLLLGDAYGNLADVRSRGHSGYTTRWALELGAPRRYVAGIERHRSSLVVLWLGANDSVLPGRRQHVPLDEYRANLRLLVEQVQAETPGAEGGGQRHVLLITPPPIHFETRERLLRERTPPVPECDRTQSNTKRYADACAEVAAEKGVACLHLYNEMVAADATGPEYLRDGLHFSQAGNQFVFDAVMATIAAKMPDLHPSNLEADFPHHSRVDEADSAGSIAAFGAAPVV